MAKSEVVIQSNSNKHKSRLVIATQLASNVELSSMPSDGVFGSKAIIKSGGVTLKSWELDFEFEIPFDDNLESNEGEIIVYNLSNETIKGLKAKQDITVEAGYEGDTGVIFDGYITKVSTKREEADKITTIKIIDDIGEKKDIEQTFESQKASGILRELLYMTTKPIEYMQIKRDYTYEDSVTVDDTLESAIKKYSEVCNVSTFTRKGRLYCCNLNDLYEVNFNLSEETGLIGSPVPYSEERTAEEFTDTINGLEIEMLLQHRIQVGSGIKLTSKNYNGTYQVRSGKHTFNEGSAITSVKVV